MKDRIEKVSSTKRFRYEYRGSGRPEKRIVEIKCCSEWLECYSFTNTCDHCGQDYNFSGQMLAPRYCWGEETGEHWTECV